MGDALSVEVVKTFEKLVAQFPNDFEARGFVERRCLWTLPGVDVEPAQVLRHVVADQVKILALLQTEGFWSSIEAYLL